MKTSPYFQYRLSTGAAIFFVTVRDKIAAACARVDHSAHNARVIDKP